MTDLSLKILTKSINSIPLFIKGTFLTCQMPFVVCFSIDKLTKSMLSITSSQKHSTIQWMISTVEFISLSLRNTETCRELKKESIECRPFPF